MRTRSRSIHDSVPRQSSSRLRARGHVARTKVRPRPVDASTPFRTRYLMATIDTGAQQASCNASVLAPERSHTTWKSKGDTRSTKPRLRALVRSPSRRGGVRRRRLGRDLRSRCGHGGLTVSGPREVECAGAGARRAGHGGAMGRNARANAARQSATGRSNRASARSRSRSHNPFDADRRRMGRRISRSRARRSRRARAARARKRRDPREEARRERQEPERALAQHSQMFLVRPPD